jgi:hypothetical protein
MTRAEHEENLNRPVTILIYEWIKKNCNMALGRVLGNKGKMSRMAVEIDN